MIERHAAWQQVTFEIRQRKGVVGVNLDNLPGTQIWAPKLSLDTGWPVDISHHDQVSILETGWCTVSVSAIMMAALSVGVSFTQRSQVRGQLT